MAPSYVSPFWACLVPPCNNESLCGSGASLVQIGYGTLTSYKDGVPPSSNGLTYTQTGNGITFTLTDPAKVSFMGAFEVTKFGFYNGVFNGDNAVPDGMGLAIGTAGNTITCNFGKGILFVLSRAGEWDYLATHVISESDIGGSNAEFVFTTQTLDPGTYWVGIADFAEADLSTEIITTLKCNYLVIDADPQEALPPGTVSGVASPAAGYETWFSKSNKSTSKVDVNP